MGAALTGRTVGVLVGLAVAAYTRSFWKGLASAAAIDFVTKQAGFDPQINPDIEVGASALSALVAEHFGVM